MKNQLFSLIVSGLLFVGYSNSLASEFDVTAQPSKMSFDFAVSGKTVFDVCAGLSTGYCVANMLIPFASTNFLKPDDAQIFCVLSGIGCGFLACLATHHLYKAACKQLGFSDTQVEKICTESNEQKFNIIVTGAALITVELIKATIKSCSYYQMTPVKKSSETDKNQEGAAVKDSR